MKTYRMWHSFWTAQGTIWALSWLTEHDVSILSH